jgi:[protein-PII] uridylyltransferase
MNATIQSLRAELAQRYEDIAKAHRSGSAGLDTCSALSAAMDDAIKSAFQLSSRGAREHVAVLALGGYGRGELCPKSDIDVTVLCESGKVRQAAGEVATSFLHSLWDANVNIGHSVRTVDEAIALHGNSLDAWTSMVESRYLCGNANLVRSFAAEIERILVARKDTWLIEGIFADMRSRHDRYGNSVKLLEPNVKKSAGGLRDFHSLLWLHRGTDPHYAFRIEAGVPASRTFLEILQKDGVLDPGEQEAALAAVQFLFRVRHEMHYHRDSLHDTLEYGLQLDVAEALGYGPKDQLSSVEVFMRDYYLHARTIYRLNRRLGRRFRELIEPSHHAVRKSQQLSELFILHDDVLSARPGVERLAEAKQIFEAFVYTAEHDVDIDFRLYGIIERSVDLLTDDQQASPEIASMVRRILGSRNVARTLRAMNEVNVLGRYIPEFGELIAFFQHNVYHYFTADEHTLIAVANAERLREQQGVLHEVFRNLRRKDVLFMSILLHDIAKPRGVADHEIAGVEMAKAILHRLGMDDAIPDVSFLIRNHLVMEQIAFRRDIQDPGTIREFAARFEQPAQLDYLYLLTYADLSALNVNVWTEWKASMLEDLYQRTSEVLRRNLRGEQIDEFHQSRRSATIADIVEKLSVTIPREDVERHIRGIPSDSYIAVFADHEIAQHIQVSDTRPLVSTMFNHTEGYTEATVIARDAPFALSRFCAVLSANDANIFDANIFTREDGIIIDRFRVSDATTRHQLDQRVCAKITEDLNQVMEGKLDIEHLFQAHKRKWKRRPKPPMNPNIRTDVQFEDNPRYTIIDVYAPDSVGVLYRITETISTLGLDIYFAKIATRVDGIVDAFYILDRSGKPVTDQSRREHIRAEILNTVKALAEQRLE